MFGVITYESKRKNPAELKALFEKIALTHHGVFDLVESRFQTKYQIRMKYLEEDIFIQNELGVQRTGLLVCKMDIPNFPLFKIDEKNPIFQFFNRKADRLHIKCKDPKLKRFIIEQTSFKAMNILAKADGFQPIITGEIIDNQYRIETRYHLDFIRHMEGVELLLDFYRSLIGYLKTGY